MRPSRDRAQHVAWMMGGAAAAAGILVVVTIAAAAPRASTAVATGPRNLWLVPVGLAIAVLVAVVLMVLAAVALLEERVLPTVPPLPRRATAPWALVVGAGGLFLANRLFGPFEFLGRLRDLFPGVVDDVAADGRPPAEVVYDAPTVPLALVLAGILLGALVLVRRRGAAATAPLDVAVATARGHAVSALLDDPEPRRAVVGAWVRFEATLDAAGWGRREPEAPREYVARVLEGRVADATAVRSLADLYEHARFSPHPVDDGMRRRALEALRRIEVR